MEKRYTIITGATGGLGQAFVNECARLNQNLILTGRNLSKLQETKNLISKLNSDLDIQIYQCDFSKNQEIINLANEINSKYSIDLLINNAGNIIEGSIENSSLETIQNCITVNCLGTITLTKLILDKHKDNNLKIITISSLAGKYPLPYMTTYASTKSLLTSFMLACKYEYKHHNVKILVVQPGAIPTSTDMKEAIKAQGLKGRLSAVSPMKIAKKSLKLIKRNKSSYIPGLFNKLTYFVSLITPLSLQIKIAGKMWKKSQAKRNIK